MFCCCLPLLLLASVLLLLATVLLLLAPVLLLLASVLLVKVRNAGSDRQYTEKGDYGGFIIRWRDILGLLEGFIGFPSRNNCSGLLSVVIYS